MTILQPGIRLCWTAAALLLSTASSAATVCTYDRWNDTEAVRGEKTETLAALQTRVFREYIELGNAAAAENALGEAAFHFASVFGAFAHEGREFGTARCADQSLYAEAATRLRDVGSRYAAELMARGDYLSTDSPPGGQVLPGGALDHLLVANDYDGFIEHSLDYAASVLREREVRNELNGLAETRRAHLESARDGFPGTSMAEWHRDVRPLLDVELAGIDKLEGFSEKLAAYLAPLYPAITDYWLKEEARRYGELLAIENAVQQSMFVDYAAGAIEAGVARLQDIPDEAERITRRGNERGEAFMAQERYALARAYFEAAGNREQYARADELTRREEQATVAELKSTLEKELEEMQKSDEEKAAFEKEAEDMAAEFDFDMED